MENLPKLKIRSGSLAGTEWDISRDEFLIGREESCDLVLGNTEVSRKHARIFQFENKFFIEDLDSTNGTFLNGRNLSKPQPLSDGDLVTIGEKNVFEFSFEELITEVTAHSEGKLQKPILTQEEIVSEDELIEEVPQSPEILDEQEEKGGIFNRMTTWQVVLVLVLIFLVIFCLIPFIVIEVTNQWCTLFSGFFNAINPGVCP